MTKQDLEKSLIEGESLVLLHVFNKPTQTSGRIYKLTHENRQSIIDDLERIKNRSWMGYVSLDQKNALSRYTGGAFGGPDLNDFLPFNGELKRYEFISNSDGSIDLYGVVVFNNLANSMLNDNHITGVSICSLGLISYPDSKNKEQQHFDIEKIHGFDITIVK